jgi:hypothetical protein
MYAHPRRSRSRLVPALPTAVLAGSAVLALPATPAPAARRDGLQLITPSPHADLVSAVGVLLQVFD